MTIICALHDHVAGVTWIGADGRMTSDKFVWPMDVEKWTDIGRFRLGMAGSGRAAVIVGRRLHDLRDFAHPQYIADSLREAMISDGWKSDDARGPQTFDTYFMLANAAGVWAISGTGTVIPFGLNFAAMGSGEDYAYGAAYALMNGDRHVSAEWVVRGALGAACAFDAACGGQLMVECLAP